MKATLPVGIAGRLNGKVALVTGGSRGIGAAVVARLAREGAAVVFTFVGSSAAAEGLRANLQEEGAKVTAFKADSGDRYAAKEAVEATLAAYGRIDILVNNAALALGGPLVDASPDDIERMIAVNVRGPVLSTQEALRHMTSGGRIINIGSSNTDFFPFPGASLYTMSKGAVAGLTRGLARELGARGITVNNVQPGPTDTDMNPASGALAEQITKLIGVQRYAQTDEIAGAVAYLASDEAAFVTGANIKVDGGLSA